MIQARLINVVALIFIALYNLQRVLVDTEKLITAIYGTARLIHSFIAQAILENSVIAFKQLQLIRTEQDRSTPEHRFLQILIKAKARTARDCHQLPSDVTFLWNHYYNLL